MCPTSIATCRCRCPPQRGHASPSRTSRRSANRGLVVAAGLDAAQVDVVAVGADHVLALAQRLVGDHVDRDADRADRAARGAEGLADLLLLGRPEVLAEGLEELHLVQPVVAADEREHDAFRRPRRASPSPSREDRRRGTPRRLDRPLARRLDFLRLARAPRGNRPATAGPPRSRDRPRSRRSRRSRACSRPTRTAPGSPCCRSRPSSRTPPRPRRPRRPQRSKIRL